MASDEIQTMFELESRGNTLETFKAGKRAEFNQLKVSTSDRDIKLADLRKRIADATKEIGELEAL